MLTLAILLWTWVAAAAPELPPELEGWQGWVAAEDWPCATRGDEVTCLWPGRFTLDAGAGGAEARLDVRVDRPLPVPLPGGAGTWPQGVRVDGRPAPVREVDGVPTLDLPSGDHVVTWTVPWTARPPTFPVGGRATLVALSLDGVVVPFPQMDDPGQLRLGAGDGATPAEERLDVEVFRRVEDGVPVLVTTEIAVRASGGAREVDLGVTLPAGLRPVALAADLPVRLTPGGTLALQVRPGSFRVVLTAVSLAPLTELRAPRLPAPWPPLETWSVQTQDRVRTVNLSGPPGVDPARTSMPAEWKGLPAFQVTPATPLRFEELRRGEPEAPVNALHAHRELWIDLDGGGLTARDRVTGTMQRGWRLDVVPPLVLGHASLGGIDQVVTTREVAPGVELRATAIDLVAESRLEGDPRAFAAVGWTTDVQSLAATLHVPPGWELLWVRGADHVSGLAPWSLFDLFYVLVVALALSKLLGRRWGALALAALVVSRHVAGAPDATWSLLVVVAALERAVSHGAVRRGLAALRTALVVALFAILVPFSVDQVQEGLFPQLARPWEHGGAVPGVADPAPPTEPTESGGFDERAAASMDAAALGAELIQIAGGSRERTGEKKEYLSQQLDPAAAVQTGPGVPTWSWATHELGWSGPVGAGHEVSLVLLGPWPRFGLALLRVGLLLALALRLAGMSRAAMRGAAPAVGLLATLALVPRAEAAPSPELLTELRDRIAPDRSCRPVCAVAPDARLRVEGDRLRVEVEVHASVDASWPLPGPVAAWAPASVTLDGGRAALASADGHAQVRVPVGVHRIVLEGPLPPKDALALTFPAPPKRLAFESAAWRVEGLKADGTPAATIQLVRSAPSGEVGTPSGENLAPWIEVRRFLDLGLPWQVRTEVVRSGPSSQPVALRVPLLPGESVLDEGIDVLDGVAVLGLGRDQDRLAWTSTLATTSTVVLTAPSEVPWTERWTVSCSPIYACAASGTPPTAHVDEARGAWAPTWSPWPGETVTLEVTRPTGVAGQTLTIDQATLRWSPGLRIGLGELALSVRTSQGGQLPLTLPASASLREVQVRGEPKPLQLRSDGVLPVPLQPGVNEVVVRWQQEHAFALVDEVPAVGLGAAAVNAAVVVELPPTRWILALRGPAWGPVPLYWVYLALVLVAAPLLRRIPFTPLTTVEWALLGLGLTQVPVFVPLFLVLVLVALGARGAHPPRSWWVFNVVQLTFVPVLLVALGSLYAAIHAGLLVQPDLQVEGNASSDTLLRWYADRVDGALPTPSIVSVPLWTFRVAMLLWSLWLAAFVVARARWVWRCLTAGGLLRAPAPGTTPPSPS